MTNQNDTEDLPSLADFYRHGLIPIKNMPANTDCSICYEPFEAKELEPGEHVVSLPCKYIFHRQCITAWFSTVLIHPVSGDRNNDQMYGTCPFHRNRLFHAIGTDARHVINYTWAQSLHGLIGTKYEVIAREALDRINTQGPTDSLVNHYVNRMIQADKQYEDIAVELRVRQAPRQPTRLILQRHEVNVDTEQDQSLTGIINQTIRGDLDSLKIIIYQYLPDDGDQIDWISLVNPILQEWHANSYPRTTYITLDSLHRLVICAGLVTIGGTYGQHRDTLSYAHLLAHADRALLEAQRQVRTGGLNPAELREYHRVLNWREDNTAAQNNLPVYRGNAVRVAWITNLRQRTRGRNADPLGPAPP